MRHECCYHNCPRGSVVHIGANGGNSHWICFRHLEKWKQTRARFLAAGLPCAMEELPKRSVRKWIKPSVYGGAR
jgi:hypothetical protein